MSYPVLTRARCSVLSLPNAVRCQDQLRHYLFRMDHHSVFKHTCVAAEIPPPQKKPQNQNNKNFFKNKEHKKAWK